MLLTSRPPFTRPSIIRAELSSRPVLTTTHPSVLSHQSMSSTSICPRQMRIYLRRPRPHQPGWHARATSIDSSTQVPPACHEFPGATSSGSPASTNNRKLRYSWRWSSRFPRTRQRNLSAPRKLGFKGAEIIVPPCQRCPLLPLYQRRTSRLELRNRWTL